MRGRKSYCTKDESDRGSANGTSESSWQVVTMVYVIITTFQVLCVTPVYEEHRLNWNRARQVHINPYSPPASTLV